MAGTDCQPLADAPATDRIRQRFNNRLGAVYSAVYSFWFARYVAGIAGRKAVGVRRDAFSVILFNSGTENVLVHDCKNNLDRLLDVMMIMMIGRASGGKNFTLALQAGQNVMEQHWSTERFVIESRPLLSSPL